ncbi:MAG: alpha/beta fold hydrolase [Acidimicrobiales bacterium]
MANYSGLRGAHRVGARLVVAAITLLSLSLVLDGCSTPSAPASAPKSAAPHGASPKRSGGTTVATLPAAQTVAAHIAWAPCPNRSGYLCGTLKVPLDYQYPSRGSVDLSVIERPVANSKGVVIFNPGGPGESGVLIMPILAALVPATVRDQFTLVSFDERGTGSSDPLLCGPSLDAATSAVAGTAAAAATFSGTEHSCSSRYPALFPTVNTTTSARDMNELRIALGVDRINYYGLSYGTVLGSVYRQLFPSHVRSMVLDGAVDLNLSLASEATEEAPSIQTVLEHDLNSCTEMASCPLGADPVAFYRDLQQRLSRAPLPAPGKGDTTPVTEGDLYTATLLYLSVPGVSGGFFPALAAAAAGNGAQLRAVALGLETDLNGQSLVGPLWTITCNDEAEHPDASATAALARSLEARFPLGGAEAVSNNLIACPGWTEMGGSVARLSPISPNKAPTSLVIGNTYDPNTPYDFAVQLASAIGGRLVTYVGYGHTWLLNGSTNVCMQNVVTAYLVNGVVPPKGVQCAASS